MSDSSKTTVTVHTDPTRKNLETINDLQFNGNASTAELIDFLVRENRHYRRVNLDEDNDNEVMIPRKRTPLREE